VRVGKAVAVLLRFLLIGWASVWIAALPLFHTHLPGIFQQPFGIPHTVFSPDLPGEYSAFSHQTVPDESRLSVLALHSPELGFVASAASVDEDGKRKPRSDRSISLVPALIAPTLASQRIQVLPPLDPHTQWSSHSHGIRAPPAPVSL
jgi:hypothetical protein